MQFCTSPQTDNHARIPPLSFLQAGCPSCHPTNSIKSLKAIGVSFCLPYYNFQYMVYSPYVVMYFYPTHYEQQILNMNLLVVNKCLRCTSDVLVLKLIFTTQRHASMVLAIILYLSVYSSVCTSLCHMPVLCQNG